MPEILEFDILHEYSVYKAGITVEAILRIGDFALLMFEAKIDTGSTYCVFERHLGEGLNLKIEAGIPIEIGTATGSFPAFGHEVTLKVLGIETVSTVYFAESKLFRPQCSRQNRLARPRKIRFDRAGRQIVFE